MSACSLVIYYFCLLPFGQVGEGDGNTLGGGGGGLEQQPSLTGMRGEGVTEFGFPNSSLHFENHGINAHFIWWATNVVVIWAGWLCIPGFNANFTPMRNAQPVLSIPSILCIRMGRYMGNTIPRENRYTLVPRDFDPCHRGHYMGNTVPRENWYTLVPRDFNPCHRGHVTLVG